MNFAFTEGYLRKSVEESICVLVGERGRKTVKHCIIRIFVILAMYFEGYEKKN